ncbi:hypothetical protein [Caenispirillum salinarum]|uniref:hypothetical protein n=1 Tax=Caenispirillum salinarum TaxID=859058 RepID=UPI00384CD49B
MSQFLKPFLVALDGHPEVADMIAESAEAEGFEAVALQDRRLIETTLAVAAADVLVVDLDGADRALAALSRRPEQERPPRVILMTEVAISGSATPMGLAADVVATLHKPLTAVGLTDALREAFAAVRGDGTGR